MDAKGQDLTACACISRGDLAHPHQPLLPPLARAKMTDPRAKALEIFQDGVAAADPYARVQASLDLVIERPAQIIAIGKAAVRMAEAALEAYPGTPTLVVTNYENARELTGATVMAAGHPIPDANGLKAGEAVIKALSDATGPVLALISGGGSALLPAPATGISLDEKAAVNAALLSSGIEIMEMNLVRQQLSRLKGGGMLRHAAPNMVTALILSDVIGDELSAIASGPTVAPLGDKTKAKAILDHYGIWKRMPEAVKAHLLAADEDSALPSHENHLIGSNGQSVEAMRLAGDAQAISTPIEGDVTDAARQICDACEKGTTVWGGETTVVLKGDGRGGRNQELALRIALEAEARGWTDWTCLQGGSDGRDGPTDAAGGLVDSSTLQRIRDAGGNLEALLENNDSYQALALAGDLLMTDATGTNVADLGVMIRR